MAEAAEVLSTTTRVWARVKIALVPTSGLSRYNVQTSVKVCEADALA